MGVLEDLKQLSAAEEFFQYLGVDYEPSVVNVARLHILKRMGQYLARETPQGSDAELRARCAEHLQAAYADFVAKTPIEARVFKVHQDAVKAQTPKPVALVTIQPLLRE
ncbi:MAG TPA: nitrogenase stabilizing/protective protein NifW [Polyangiales bacterium]|nr:nitrogenase stabilizing/protective protein NifW [Polyangiales bacterium]